MEQWKQEFYHHGILGMKWGKRNGPPYPLNKSDYSALEKAAIKKEYKRRKKAGETVPFKRYRNSTGQNYNRVEKEYSKKLETITKDAEYRKLSKAAYDAERKRLMSEKKFYNKKDGTYDDDKYEKHINSAEYKKLDKASEEATRKKEEYAEKRQAQIKSEYVDKFKDAKLDDLEIFDKESRDNAKQWVDANIRTIYVYDDNLDYNIDNFYEDWVEKEKFK